jgi:diguanylate cyclase (GGDEF)-like protein/PAS domain S-box-containing protein
MKTLLLLALMVAAAGFFAEGGALALVAVYGSCILACLAAYALMSREGERPTQAAGCPRCEQAPERQAAPARPPPQLSPEASGLYCVLNNYSRNLLEANLDPMAVIDRQGRIIDVNQALEEVTGKSRSSLTGNDLSECFLQRPLALAALQRAFGGAPVRHCPLSLQHTSGRLTEVMCSIGLHRDAGGEVQGAFVVARDMTDLLQYETQMSFQASCDALTALPNRLMFRERLGRALARADREGGIVALMFIDLDNFKDVNESLGHETGDDLLRGTANLLVDTLPEASAVARMGGDEFAVLVEDMDDPQQVEAMAAQVLGAVGKLHVIDGNEVAVTCSIGITMYPSDSRDLDTLLRNVDTAMYRAKEEGKNNCQYFAVEMNEPVLRRVEIGNALRRALKQNEFTLHYQPRVELGGGAIVGAEALLRWHSGLIGAVSPAEFIPVAENNGMIVQIGEWVLHQACERAMQWHAEGLAPAGVAVNLSARQFRDVDIVKTVLRALHESGLPPHLLELELTESMLMHDVKRVLRTLHALKEIGVKLAIDDFGTGYSSLSYLKSFPLDYLKIDRSFIRDIPQDRNGEAIVRAIVVMAHSLGIKVIAEGVESGDQLSFLLEQKCDEIQGYYFSKPVPAAAFEAMLRRGEVCGLQPRTPVLQDLLYP